MLVKRFAEAGAYEVPGHHGCAALAMTDWPKAGPQSFAVSLSHFLPGGGAGPDSAPLERVYVVTAGRLKVMIGGEEAVLEPNDAVYIRPGEVREIHNPGNDVASMIVVRQLPA